MNESYIVCVNLLMDGSECCVVCYSYDGMTSG